MKTLVIGANGQMGWELQRTCPGNISLITCDYPGIDLCSKASIHKCITAASPDCIINAAAYTAVDKAEQQKDLAYKINHEAVREIAELAGKNKITMVHISTDFVFNGKNFRPYQPEDTPFPESVYGKSKLKGELAVKQILGREALIIRTAWLYSSHGNNFVKNMLNLMKDRDSLNVIDEQIGTPTWANGLANAVWAAVEKKMTGTFHFTDAGIASWYDFAVSIQEEALAAGLLSKTISIHPVPASQYPTPAKRPLCCILDKQTMWQAAGINPVHWRIQLRTMLQELTN